MKISLIPKQTAFYTINGFLELEELLSPSECARFEFSILEAHTKHIAALGRDLWRHAPLLKDLLCKVVAKLALLATNRSSLRLVSDQWFPPEFSLEKLEKAKDLFSVQGLVCVIFLQFNPAEMQIPPKQSTLGLLPFPKGQGSALIVNPDLLLNWPSTNVGLYAAAFALPTCCYIQNPKDPCGLALKKLGYGYGDTLKNDTHPLIMA